MKEKTKFECEICNVDYDTKEEAIKCEQRGNGKENQLPIGTLYSLSYCGKHMIFCIAKNESLGHHNNAYAWACRDGGLGDNLGKGKFCSGIDKGELEHTIPVNKNSKAHKRMIDFLKTENIKPLYRMI